jgi:TM2 domain-containing membrane protein YozV
MSAPQGPTPGPASVPVESKRILCGILAIIPLTGSLGIHKFVTGRTTPGIIMVVGTCTLCGYPIMAVIGVIEGIMYLTKTDEQFIQMYQVEKKGWF